MEFENDTFDVHLRIYMKEFQGRKNRDAFSLRMLELLHLAIHKLDNNATLLKEIIEVESTISPCLSPRLLFLIQLPLQLMV